MLSHSRLRTTTNCILIPALKSNGGLQVFLDPSKKAAPLIVPTRSSSGFPVIHEGMARQTPFVPRVGDNDTLWEVEIIAENARKYHVLWAGADPDTGKPWEPSWVDKSDCTDQAVARWEAKKKGKVTQSRIESGKNSLVSPSLSVISAEGTNERATVPVEKHKRQREDVQDEGPHDISKKSKKHVLSHPANVTASSSSTARTTHTSPSVKIGPPHGAKRKKEIQTAAEVSCVSAQRSSQGRSSTRLLAAQPSSPLDSIHVRQGGTSDRKAGRSPGASPTSTATNVVIVPALASVAVQTIQVDPFSLS